MKILSCSIILLISICSYQLTFAEKLVELTVVGDITHTSLLFPADTGKGAVLVHQSGKTMESWREFALVLAEKGITSIALSSMTPDDVLAAVNYLEEKKHDDIILIGASIGGAAITQALAAHDFDSVKKVVLLSPATGPAMTSDVVKKLILVAKADFYNSRSYSTFAEAVEPKVLVEYEGTEHGQALLTGGNSKFVEQAILKFLELPSGEKY